MKPSNRAELPATSLSRSLTRRVQLLSLIAALGLVGTITLGLVVTWYRAHVRMARISDEATGLFDRFFLDVQSDLKATGDGLASRSDRDSALLALLARNRALMNACYVNPDGFVVAQRRAVGRPALNGRERPEWLRTPPGYGEVAIGPVCLDGDKPYVDLAAPASDDISLPAGILLARVDVTALWNTALDLKVGETGYVYLVDRAGQVVSFRSRRLLEARDVPTGRAGSTALWARASRTGLRKGLLGELVLSSTHPLTAVPWLAVVEQPVREALAPLSLPVLTLVAALVIVGFLLYGTIDFVNARIVVPLLTLRDAVVQMADGTLGQSVPVAHNDELGQLGGSFNRMASQLAKAFVDLEDQIRALDRAKTALGAGEARFRRILGAIPLPIAHAVGDGSIVYRNDRFIRVFGYSAAEVPDIAAWWLKAYPNQKYREWVKAMWEAAVRNAAAEGRDIEPIEYRVTCADGQERIVEIWGIVLGDELLATFIDLTERKRLEDQLRQAQKMEAVGQLAGGVAHDFNNILAAMTLQLDLLEQERAASPVTAEAVEALKAGATRAASLIRQLLMFSRQSALEIQVLDVNELLDNLVSMLTRLVGEHVTLAFEGRGTVPTIEADAGMLDQVFMNLVVNARDAMPAGGRITLGSKSVVLDAGRSLGPNGRQGEFVCLSVADTGCGMDRETLKRIYEPFFTTKAVGKGTGLGLATVYGIVAQHQGWIEVDSEVGRGTTFRIFLPASGKPTRRVDKAEARALEAGHGTILVVEDDQAVRHVLGQALRKQGYRVLEAADGREAMAIWRENSGAVDLLLTDMVMPGGLMGVELAERLRKDIPSLKVIISSGYGVETTRLDESARKDSILYLPKPYEVSQLCALLTRSLKGD